MPRTPFGQINARSHKPGRARMSAATVLRGQDPRGRMGKLNVRKVSSEGAPFTLLRFPSLMIPRVVFICAPHWMTILSSTTQNYDTASFEQSVPSLLPTEGENRRQTGANFAAVKLRGDGVFHDFQYIARFVILGSTLYRPSIEERSRNHVDRVCRATSLLYDATIPISRHKVVFFRIASRVSK